MSFTLNQVTVQLGSTQALRDVSLSIRKGEAVALVGPSGGGKTTLLRCLTAAVQPTVGTVSALGKDLSTCTPAQLQQLRCGLGFIPQQLGLVPAYRVLQNVMLGQAGSRGLWRGLRDLLWTQRSDTEAVYTLLQEMGVGEKIYERTSSLSGGQQQRVAIARALFQQPQAILADEPVSSLDPARAQSIIELLLRSVRERGLTLITSLHHVALAQQGFDRIISLREGRVFFDKPATDISPAEWAAVFALPTH
jgi:phosphonate transport system ATP-binding protein